MDSILYKKLKTELTSLRLKSFGAAGRIWRIFVDHFPPARHREPLRRGGRGRKWSKPIACGESINTISSLKNIIV